MSLIVIAISTALSLMLGAFAVDVAHVGSLRARAQLAADAAALAAVVENTIAGGGEPRGRAEEYAAKNGARLMSCSCHLGSASVRVKVEVGGVEAEASAEIDPAAIGPATPSGMNPKLAAAVARLLEAGGGAIAFGSAFRHRSDQQRLWDQALIRYGDPEVADDWVARPGTSMHERGLAVDLRGDLALAGRIVQREGLPLHRPLSYEPWHFELVGSRS